MINMTNLQVGSCHWGKTSIINVLGVGLGVTRKDGTKKEGPVKSINVPLDSKTQANSKSDFPCPNGFCIQTSSLVFLFFLPHINHNLQCPETWTRRNRRNRSWGLKLAKFCSKLYGKSQELYGKSQELYGKSQELSWNAMAAWQISIRKFPCLLKIFNYTKIWSKHHFQAHWIRQFCGGEEKQPHADSES